MLFAATPDVRRQGGTYAMPLITGTLASSAVLNASCEGASGGYVLHGASIGFGIQRNSCPDSDRCGAVPQRGSARRERRQNPYHLPRSCGFGVRRLLA